jgi:putative CocE/NonD family hydrolase
MTKLFESVTIAMDQNRLGQFLGLPAQLMLKGVRPVDADKNHALLRAAIREHVGTERLHSDALRVEYRDDTIAGGLTADSLSSFVQAQALARSGVAIYNWSGWYDGAIVRSAIDRFNVVRAPGSRLILGPWTHAGSANLSPFAAGPRDFDADGELLRFFDFHLKGARNGLDTLPPVRYFTMGEEQWHSADSWPPPVARMVPYYLTAERGLAAGDANGQPDARDSLALVLSGTGDHTRWNPLIGPGSSRAKIVDRAALDRALPGYGTSVLEEDVVITGQPIVSLQVSSTLEDGALFVYLDDVDPSGAVHGVSEGMLRLIHRGPATRACQNRVPPTHSFLRRDAAPMSVGRVEEVTFDLLPVSYLVRRGHRIRLSISGGDPDHFRQMSAPMQSVDISYGALNPSCVVLPVMPVAPNEHAE